MCLNIPWIATDTDHKKDGGEEPCSVGTAKLGPMLPVGKREEGAHGEYKEIEAKVHAGEEP